VPPLQGYQLYLQTPRVPALRAFTLGFAVTRLQRFDRVNYRAGCCFYVLTIPIALAQDSGRK
jgi:hypothetical protein